ncbi:hypothetical protein F943_01485 [Acinetobacter ursingii NIPH 706]|nr:hypothetical protein F943_01485 [Acinetobacter ursingii NIPH 706]
MFNHSYLISPASNFIGIILYKDGIIYSRNGESIDSFTSIDEAKKYLLDSVALMNNVDLSESIETNTT